MKEDIDLYMVISFDKFSKDNIKGGKKLHNSPALPPVEIIIGVPPNSCPDPLRTPSPNPGSPSHGGYCRGDPSHGGYCRDHPSPTKGSPSHGKRHPK